MTSFLDSPLCKFASSQVALCIYPEDPRQEQQDERVLRRVPQPGGLGGVRAAQGIRVDRGEVGGNQEHQQLPLQSKQSHPGTGKQQGEKNSATIQLSL